MRLLELRERVATFWLAPEHASNVIAARILLAASGLWLILSRHDLPGVLSLPKAILATIPMQQRVRFLILMPVGIERVLWVALHIALLAALFGIWSRWSCLAAGLLLYHFGPFETIIWTPNPYLRGVTIPCLGLLIISFATSSGDSAGPGWALRLTQLLFAEIYFFAGYSKLFAGGLAWLGANNMQHYLTGLDQFLGFSAAPTVGHWLAQFPLVCSTIAVIGLVFELAFPLVLFFRRLRWIFIPMAFFFHVANWLVFHIFFQNAFLLLMFVNWEWVLARVVYARYHRRGPKKEIEWVNSSG